MLLSQDVLYFPHIDISQSSLLPTAILTWDHINSIVPHGYKNPYNTPNTTLLFEAEILRPSQVRSDQYDVGLSSRKFLRYLETPAAKRLLSLSASENLPLVVHQQDR